MCGISVSLLTPGTADAAAASSDAHLRRRGPDSAGEIVLWPSAGVELRLSAAVLGLRGAAPTPQPLRDDFGNILLWNGELFGGEIFDAIAAGASDSAALLAALSSTTSVPTVMASLVGPWAFAYWSAATRTLWYGRDALGRRSLLRARPGGDHDGAPLLLSSVAAPLADANASWEELPVDGIGSVELLASGVARHGWRRRAPAALAAPDRPLAAAAETAADASRALLRALSAAVRVRVRCAPAPAPGAARAAVMFSGGLDSMVLARLADAHLPPDEPIDLLHVAFGAGAAAAPDRLAALCGVRELRRTSARAWRLVLIDVSLDELAAARAQLEVLLAPAATVMDVNIGAALWFGARGRGTLRTRLGAAPPPAADARDAADGDGNGDGDGDALEDDIVDDDEAGVPQREYPSDDEACAEGALDGREYRSAARVLLLGMGADEQMGGYGRHRTAYRKGGAEALRRELAADCERMWLRNLGRDDRVLSDWGREPRFPFLDEGVTALLARMPLPLVCELEREPGAGDKAVLRRAARALGLGPSAALQKRAIQFGTRIANRRNKGGGEAKEVALLGSLKEVQVALAG